MMLSTLLTSMALAALPVLGAVNPNARSNSQNNLRKLTERDYLAFFWQAYTPTPSSASFDAHYDDTNWFALASDDAGVELDTSGDKLGYRLTGDDSSAVVFHLSSNNVMVDATYSYDGDEDDGPSVDITGTLSAFYSSTTGSSSPYSSITNSSSSSSSDVWDSTDTATIVMNKTVSAQNVDCASGMGITITTLDANGDTLVYTGTDSVSASVPTALPANVTISNDINNATALLVYNGIEPVSAAFGSGNVPVPQASFDAVVQYCPD